MRRELLEWVGKGHFGGDITPHRSARVRSQMCSCCCCCCFLSNKREGAWCKSGHDLSPAKTAQLTLQWGGKA